MGCRLWGRTESDMTEATQQQQQQQLRTLINTVTDKKKKADAERIEPKMLHWLSGRGKNVDTKDFNISRQKLLYGD